jgi:hypothetical protein
MMAVPNPSKGLIVCNNLLFFVTIFVVLLTQNFWKLLETFVFLSVNLTIFAKKFFHKNGFHKNH